MFQYEELKNAMADLEEDKVLEIMEEVKQTGENVQEAMEACQKGMEVVGKRFEEGEYFVGDLIYAGEVMNGAMDVIRPLISQAGTGPKTKMILCTVKDDLHDIGKNIVASVLNCNGFHVIDLGVDVQPETFVEAVKKYDPKVIGMSCLLTTSFEPLKNCISAIREAGLDKGRLIMIGGSPINQTVCDFAGADTFTNDAQSCFNKAREFVESSR